MRCFQPLEDSKSEVLFRYLRGGAIFIAPNAWDSTNLAPKSVRRYDSWAPLWNNIQQGVLSGKEGFVAKAAGGMWYPIQMGTPPPIAKTKLLHLILVAVN